jgi:hypothetical protein
MPRWKIVSGAREYEATAEASDIAAGWAWDIQDAVNHLRAVRVEIAASAAARFGFADAERALSDVLDEADPPERLLITTGGVERR